MTKETMVELLRDATGLAGIGLVAYGSWLIYQPAGFIVAGGLMLAGVWMLAARSQ